MRAQTGMGEEAFWTLSFDSHPERQDRLLFWMLLINKESLFFCTRCKPHELWNLIDCSYSCVHLIK